MLACEPESKSALCASITGVVVTTTGRAATAATAPIVVASTFTTTAVASAIAAIFPTASSGGTIPTTTAVASTATTTAIAAATSTPVASTATATAVAATTATAVTAATATGSTATGLCLVNPERTAHQFGTLKPLDRRILKRLIGHLNEGKAALAASVAFQREGTVGDFTKLREQFNHIFLLSAEGKVADKNAHVLRGPGTKKWTEGA